MKRSSLIIALLLVAGSASRGFCDTTFVKYGLQEAQVRGLYSVLRAIRAKGAAHKEINPKGAHIATTLSMEECPRVDAWLDRWHCSGKVTSVFGLAGRQITENSAGDASFKNVQEAHSNRFRVTENIAFDWNDVEQKLTVTMDYGTNEANRVNGYYNVAGKTVETVKSVASKMNGEFHYASETDFGLSGGYSKEVTNQKSKLKAFLGGNAYQLRRGIFDFDDREPHVIRFKIGMDWVTDASTRMEERPVSVSTSVCDTKTQLQGSISYKEQKSKTSPPNGENDEDPKQTNGGLDLKFSSATEEKCIGARQGFAARLVFNATPAFLGTDETGASDAVGQRVYQTIRVASPRRVSARRRSAAPSPRS